MVLISRLLEFESAIQEVILQFGRSFGKANPLYLWRQGCIAKDGHIGPDDAIHYSLHGRGCTANIRSRTVSFDFDGEHGFTYTPFKYSLFDDDDAESGDSVATAFIELLEKGVLVRVPGRGVRLSDKYGSTQITVE